MGAKELPSYTASKAKVHLGELMETCRRSGAPILIKHHKKPYAVLLGYEEWRRQQTAPPSPSPLLLAFRALRKRLDKPRLKPGVKPAPVKELLKELRAEREVKLMGTS